MYDMLLPNVSGWRQKDNVMQHIFPTTPVEIGPGFIVGKERIVTKTREKYVEACELITGNEFAWK